MTKLKSDERSPTLLERLTHCDPNVWPDIALIVSSHPTGIIKAI